MTVLVDPAVSGVPLTAGTGGGTLPVTNAVCRTVSGGGFTEDYGTADDVDTVRWTGRAGAYVTESLLTDVAGGTVDEVAVTRLYLPLDPGRVVKRGDTVSYTVDGEDFVRRVRNVAVSRLGDEVALSLEDA